MRTQTPVERSGTARASSPPHRMGHYRKSSPIDSVPHTPPAPIHFSPRRDWTPTANHARQIAAAPDPPVRSRTAARPSNSRELRGRPTRELWACLFEGSRKASHAEHDENVTGSWSADHTRVTLVGMSDCLRPFDAALRFRNIGTADPHLEFLQLQNAFSYGDHGIVRRARHGDRERAVNSK